MIKALMLAILLLAFCELPAMAQCANRVCLRPVARVASAPVRLLAARPLRRVAAVRPVRGVVRLMARGICRH